MSILLNPFNVKANKEFAESSDSEKLLSSFILSGLMLLSNITVIYYLRLEYSAWYRLYYYQNDLTALNVSRHSKSLYELKKLLSGFCLFTH